MEDFEEYLNKQKEILKEHKLRLNNSKLESLEYLNNYMNDNYFNNEESFNQLNKNEENIQKETEIENEEHEDDLNHNISKKGPAELLQVNSSRYSSQFDLNTNSKINPDDFSSEYNRCNDKVHTAIKSSFALKKEEEVNVECGKEYLNVGGKKERNFLANSRQNNWTKRNKDDDMEQWVSDTFYSYFPSLNSEQIKREKNNEARQLDYKNYLKKISNVDNHKQNEQNKTGSKQQTARNGDKSDMEIIVTTNPHYENPSKYLDNYYSTSSPRPSSTRNKLLQDLKHTELSNMIYGDGVQVRKQAELEQEMQKKKEYQKDLMRQIEEKRREIEMLKEKERLEEETLTRKLEEQLRTVKLQEELEKEKIKTDRTRFEIERNKIIREHLISKLEQDKMQVKSPESSVRETKSENDKDSLFDSALKEKNKNEVYRFFTNSARREFRKQLHDETLVDAFEELVAQDNAQNDDFFLDPLHEKSIKQYKSSSSISPNCNHINSQICPFCEIKLKKYESWCPYCKQQILDDGAENRTMLCENCENQYLICSACDKKKIICEFCHRKRNICAKCTRNFCVHCGNSIHSYKNNSNKQRTSKHSLEKFKIPKTPSEHSFQILELPHLENNAIQTNNFKNSNLASSLENSKKFSTNYSKNSIFNPENKNSDSVFFEFGVRNGEIVINNKIYNHRNKRNVGDKTYNNHVQKFENLQNNKTIKSYTNNENISLNEMPLLSEIPKKSNLKNKIGSKEKLLKDTKKSTNSIEDLSRKWEVPVVEKRTISTHSPIVLTQLGAVRRQLQIDSLQAEFL